MSDRLHGGLQVGAAVLGLVAGVTGLFGAFVLLPSRMEAAERQIAGSMTAMRRAARCWCASRSG